MSTKQQPEVEVGMGATLCMVSDTRPGTIIEVFRNKRGEAVRLVFQYDAVERVNAAAPGVAPEYVFTPDPDGATAVFTKRRNGSWVRGGDSMLHGTRLAVGFRQYYYDPHF